MKSLPDDLALLACARAARISGRPDVVDIEFEEIELVVSVRPPTAAEWAAYIPANASQATRAAAKYNLLASCLVYPCDAKGEPDLEALAKAREELPALVSECVDSIDELACGAPLTIIAVDESTAPAAATLIGAEKLAALRSAHKRLRIVGVGAEGSPVKAFGLKAPSRISWEAAADVGIAQLVESADLLALDCIVGLTDEARAGLLKYYPGLSTLLYRTLESMAGSRRMSGEPRKKARRGSSKS